MAAADTRDLSELISDCLNVVRAGLAHVNVSLPMPMAQALAFCLAVIVIVTAWRAAFRGASKPKKYSARVLLAIAFATAAAIPYAWFDYWKSPLKSQLIGHFLATPPVGTFCELVDYADDVVSNGQMEYDEQHQDFALAYSPMFADPPRLRISAPHCEPVLLRPSRAHLRDGESMPVQFECTSK